MRKNKLPKGYLAPAAYKRATPSTHIAENVEASTHKFNENNTESTGKYNMILVAVGRARDITLGAPTELTTNHKPAVTAILEIEKGLVDYKYCRIG